MAARKYSRGAQEEVHKEMRKFKHKPGGLTRKKQKQAIAIGLSKARRKGMKAPRRPARRRTRTRRR